MSKILLIQTVKDITRKYTTRNIYNTKKYNTKNTTRKKYNTKNTTRKIQHRNIQHGIIQHKTIVLFSFPLAVTSWWCSPLWFELAYSGVHSVHL